MARGYHTLLAAFVVSSVLSCGEGIQQPVVVSAFSQDDGSSSSSAGPEDSHTESCFLNPLRSISPAEAEKEGLKDYKHKIGKDLTWGGTVFDVALIITGAVLCFAGYKLVKFAFILTGLGAGWFGTFWATSTVMTHIPKLYSCVALAIIPVAGGLIGALILYRFKKLTFVLLGGFVGAWLGLVTYLVALSHMERHNEAVKYGTVLVPAVLLGLIALKVEDTIVAIASALAGGLGFSIGFSYAVLARVNKHFVAWIQPCLFDGKCPSAPSSRKDHLAGNATAGSSSFSAADEDSLESYFVLVPIAICAIASLTGLCIQLRMLRRERAKAFTAMEFGAPPYVVDDPRLAMEFRQPPMTFNSYGGGAPQHLRAETAMLLQQQRQLEALQQQQQMDTILNMQAEQQRQIAAQMTLR